MENCEKKTMSKTKRVVLISLLSLLSLILIFVFVVSCLFFNEINAVFSFKKIDENVYYIEYKNDYSFDEFLNCGAKSDDELISFIVDKIGKGLPIEISMPDFGCSAFTAQDITGKKFLCRNYDNEFYPILVTKTSPKNGYSSVSTSDLKALGYSLTYLPEKFVDRLLMLAAPYIPFDGINEKGVAISVNMVEGEKVKQSTGKIPITTTTLIRLVLDKADSVEKAIELISKYDLNESTGGPFHYQIADSTGDSAVIEYIDEELKITRKTGNYLAITNFMIHSDAEIDNGFGYDRYEIIQNKLSETNGILSEEDCFELLKSAKHEFTNGGTSWSNVFNLTERKMTFTSFLKMDNKKIFYA